MLGVVVIICILTTWTHPQLSSSQPVSPHEHHEAGNDNEFQLFTQNFLHPNITESSEVDNNPFRPSHYLFNELDMKATQIPTCECGIRNTAKLNRDNSTSPETLIAEGEEAQVNEFPWVAALVYRNELQNGSFVWTHFCGATLINNKFVLTATHCLFKIAVEKTEVWLNEHDFLLSTETNGETVRRKAIRFIAHPNYSRIMHYNDISLVEMEEEVDISDGRLRPICLPKQETSKMVEPGEGTTAGWGQTSFAGPKSSRLLKVTLPIIPTPRCISGSASYYKRRINDYSVCAGDLEKGGKDSCPGDSGGPLLTLNSKNRLQLYGIVSWGYRCGEKNKPGVYTRVSKYREWIEHEARTGRMCKS